MAQNENIGFVGVAGERLKVGQYLQRGDDGRFYQATLGPLAGVAIEPIEAGQLFCDDRWNGQFKPVREP